MSLDDHAAELAADLDVDEEAVREDLENLVEYSVPIEEAKQSLRRKYGDGPGDDGPTTADLGDVDADTGRVTVTVQVLTAGKRPIQYQGEEQVITEGELADGTGRLRYTAWEDFDLAPGDVVTIANATVREYEGRPELNFGENATVTPADADPAVEASPGGEATLAALEPGDRARTVEVRVVEVDQRTIDGRDGETTIHSGVLADETARLPFTDWECRDAITEGATLCMENVYVREFRGVPSVNLSRFSTVAPLDRDLDPAEPTAVTAAEALDGGGAYDVILEGSVVDVRDGSGLIERCPECGRVIENGQCRSHGEVDGEDDLRVKAVLDDGTGSVTVVLDAALTESIYGGDVEDARAAAREAMDRDVVADEIADALVGRAYRARGHLSVDDFGANLEATAFEPVTDDPAMLGEAFLAEVSR
ncbi:MAG: Single-stranded DNA binding protein [Halobacteriaceae archaeon]